MPPTTHPITSHPLPYRTHTHLDVFLVPAAMRKLKRKWGSLMSVVVFLHLLRWGSCTGQHTKFLNPKVRLRNICSNDGTIIVMSLSPYPAVLSQARVYFLWSSVSARKCPADCKSARERRYHAEYECTCLKCHETNVISTQACIIPSGQYTVYVLSTGRARMKVHARAIAYVLTSDMSAFACT